MTSFEILKYITFWAGIGIIIFNVVILYLFRSGAAFTARNRDGNLKKKIPLKGLIAMGFFCLGIIGILVLASYLGIKSPGFKVSFLQLFIINLLLYSILFAYDTFVIDWLVIVKWRPHFLNIPDTMTRESMIRHIKTSIPVGMGLGIIFSLAGAVVTYFLFFV